jgi:RNA polymerase sigma-70 factor (ECF subfamily)
VALEFNLDLRSGVVDQPRRAPSNSPSASADHFEAEVCRKYAGRIRAFGLKHLRDRQAAEELVQDTLVTVLTALREGRVEDRERLGSFVIGVCRRRIVDQRRSETRRASLLATHVQDLIPEPAPEPVFALEKVGPALNDLSDRESQILHETVIQGRTAPEVAKLLGMTPANVRVIRHRALLRVRQALGWEDA